MAVPRDGVGMFPITFLAIRDKTRAAQLGAHPDDPVVPEPAPRRSLRTQLRRLASARPAVRPLKRQPPTKVPSNEL